MNLLLNPVDIDSHEELFELVSEAIGEMIRGAVLVDTALGNDEFGRMDLLAADVEGGGVLVFINYSGHDREYLRLLKSMQWCRENWRLLRKLYEKRVEIGPAPPVFVVAPRYSNSTLKMLLNIGESRIVLLRYVCFRPEGERKMLFIEKIGDSLEDLPRAVPHHPVETPRKVPQYGSPAEISLSQPRQSIIDLKSIRMEIGTDISNVSDEELIDLLG